MKQAPLQLVDYWATSLRVDALPEYERGSVVELDFDGISVEHEVKPVESPDPDEDGTRWIVGLRVEQVPCGNPRQPYSFAVAMQGLLFAHPDLKGEKLHRAVAANGPAMLFGAAREVIRAATGRGPYPAVVIPSTNFLESAKKAEALPAGSRTKKKATKSKRAAKKTSAAKK
ncbi:hypothetical protein BH23VER1_BH23VER1_29930 [soil metagenome]